MLLMPVSLLEQKVIQGTRSNRECGPITKFSRKNIEAFKGNYYGKVITMTAVCAINCTTLHCRWWMHSS